MTTNGIMRRLKKRKVTLVDVGAIVKRDGELKPVTKEHVHYVIHGKRKSEGVWVAIAEKLDIPMDKIRGWPIYKASMATK